MALMIGLSANTEKRYHARTLEFHGRSVAARHRGQKETIMRERFSGSMMTIAIAGAAVVVVISVSVTPTLAQAPAASSTVTTPAPTLTTPWGEPDVQGIWTDETDTPLQRSPKFANQEFFTEAQRAELDRQRAAMRGRDQRAERGTLADVAGAYNDGFTPRKRP